MNKKLSYMRSKSAERFARRQEVSFDDHNNNDNDDDNDDHNNDNDGDG